MDAEINRARSEAIDRADALLAVAGLPSYTQLIAMLGYAPGRRWKHVGRSSDYAEVCVAELQSSTPVEEGASLVIYRGADGKAWARPEAEFLDGRFVRAGGR